MKGHFKCGGAGEFNPEVYADDGEIYYLSLLSELSAFELKENERVEGEIDKQYNTFIVKKRVSNG